MRLSWQASLALAALLVVLTVATGCGTLSGGLESPSAVTSVALPPAPMGEPAITPPAEISGDNALAERVQPERELRLPEPAEARVAAEVPGPPPAAVASEPAPPAPASAVAWDAAAQVRDPDAVPEDYDPWEPFNERMFAFNYNVDRYVLKPTANVYRHIVPEPFQLMISNGFDNLRFPPRFVNLVLQGRFWGAFTETSRFVINSVLGVGGLFNPASDYFGIPRAGADFGQTLHKWGVGAGPFFVPPFLPPATVRDFIGRLADSAINPVAWFLLGFWPEGFAIGAGEMLNERAVNYEAFQGVEETTLDLYTAVRDGYLRRRERQLQLPAE